MRLANLDGRAVLLTDDTSGLDVHAASGGRFGPELPAIYDCWPQFAAWAGDWQPRGDTVTVDRSALGSPSPAPRQIVAIGLNYADHAKESGFRAPEGLPPVFTKSPAASRGRTSRSHCRAVATPTGRWSSSRLSARRRAEWTKSQRGVTLPG